MISRSGLYSSPSLFSRGRARLWETSHLYNLGDPHLKKEQKITNTKFSYKVNIYLEQEKGSQQIPHTTDIMKSRQITQYFY